jgi:DNA-binding winged helix-turn-helix (wHTH) protein
VLVARVRSLLRRTGRGAPVSTMVGAVAVDSAARREQSSGVDVALTRREFDVLEFLARRAGHVVSKNEIIAGVWEFDFGGDPNVVEAYVGRLRRKVDEPFGTRHIRTVRGSGYLMALMAESRHRWFRSVRVRVTAMATIAVALVLVTASVLLVSRQRAGLVEQLDESLSVEGERIADAVESGTVPSLDDDRIVVVISPADPSRCLVRRRQRRR